jgi:hypothetical protein
MTKVAMDRSDAWSLPWHELQRELALGFGVETATRSGEARELRPQALSGSSWLRRARERAAPTAAAA